MRTTLSEYCTGHDRPALLAEWDGEKNAPLTPENITYGSKRRVWWKCDRGHEWQAMVYTRTGAESGCPYCAGKARPERMERYRLALADGTSMGLRDK